MKIAVFSNNGTKHLEDLLEHWNKKHTINFEMGFNPWLAQKSDIVFIDQFDNNVNSLYRSFTDPLYAKSVWGETFNKTFKAYARALDWDVWQGMAKEEKILSWLDGVFTITEHIRDQVPAKTHLIKLGVNTDKFNLITEVNQNIILPVNDLDWLPKGTIDGIRIFAEIVNLYPQDDWKLTVHGKWNKELYFRDILFPHLIKSLNLDGRVVFSTEWIDDYNAFLNNFSYAIVPSYKEAFSYVVAECAAKGIKPIVNNWYGCEDTWPKKWIYNTHVEASQMILSGNENPSQYREFIEEKYNAQTMCKYYDLIMGL